MPSYNSAATIGDTVRSLLSQDLPLKKAVSGVYLADDCSTDDTVGVATRMWNSDVALHVVTRARNVGECLNVSTAFAEFDRAEWALILHPDDIAKPNWLSELVPRIRDASPTTASICSSWDDLLPDESVRPGEDVPGMIVPPIRGEAGSVRATLLKGCWWHISGCAIRVSAFADVGGLDPDFPYHGDWEWLLRCLERGWTVEYVPRTLILYRVRPDSSSANHVATNGDIRARLRLFRAYRTFLSDRDLATLHLRQVAYAARRGVRAALRADHRQARQSLGLAVQATRDLWRALAAGRRGLARVRVS